jgi:methanogenic corrinoid protein MtbC1
MEGQELFKKLHQAITDGDSDGLVALVQSAIDKVKPLEMIEKGMAPGMTQVGNQLVQTGMIGYRLC